MSDPATDVLATMFWDLAIINDGQRDTEANNDQVSHDINKQRHAVIDTALEALAQTNLSHLLATTQTTHLDAMPTTLPTPIPRTSSTAQNPLLTIEPRTNVEAVLLAALRESKAEAETLRLRNIALQAGNLLNQVYCGNARTQLQAQDEKKKRKGKGKLTGKARLLSGDAFYEERVEFEKEKRAEDQQKADRKGAMVQYRAAKALWDQEERKRKEMREKEVAKYQKALAAWEKAKRTAAAAAKKQGLSRPPPFRIIKPKMPPLAKGNPKPKVKDFAGGPRSSSSTSGSASATEGSEGGDSDDDDST